MSNLSQIYHEAVNLPNEETVPQTEPQRDLVKEQLKINWQKSVITLEMISSIQNEIDENIQLALELAAGYSVNKNPEKIVQVLNHVNSLNKVIKTYVNS